MTGPQLVEITGATLLPVLRLKVAEDQRHRVAENAVSIAQAHFEPAAWFRAIAQDGEPVGFAMLHDPTLPGAGPWPDYPPDAVVLWRLMIDARFQGRGIGRAAVALLTAHVRTRPAVSRFLTSYVPGGDGARGFYLRLGFVPTGRVIDDEEEAALAL